MGPTKDKMDRNPSAVVHGMTHKDVYLFALDKFSENWYDLVHLVWMRICADLNVL